MSEVDNISKNSSEKPAEENVVLGPDGQPLTKSALKKLAKEAEKEAKRAAGAARAAADLAATKAKHDADQVDYAIECYGKLSINNSANATRVGLKRFQISEITENSHSMIGQPVLLRARIHNSRMQGAKMLFLVLRQRHHSIQALLSVSPESVSKQMIKYVAALPEETIVLVEGKIQAPKEAVTSTTCQMAEIFITKFHVVSEVDQSSQKISVEDASRPRSDLLKTDTQYIDVPVNTRLDNRIIDLRTNTSQSIFRVQAAVCRLFRNFLDERGFIEIHSPKLGDSASESGASVFKVTYFEGYAYLAQSPQLAKQMCIAADFERVYEIGPVFRAEKSFTSRHLTEFMGLDLEMAIEEHYHEALDLIENLLLHIFKELKTQYAREINVIGMQFPLECEPEEFLIPEKPVRIHFKDGIAMLREAGVDAPELEDLETAHEKKLGALVREKYKTDFFTLDQFPANARPFYTMPNAEDPRYSNSYDCFMRGQEILSGAQRIHDPEYLCKRMTECGVDPSTMQGYIDAFKMGAPPHAGAGFGLERIVQFFTQLENIRRSSLFPRDPKRLSP